MRSWSGRAGCDRTTKAEDEAVEPLEDAEDPDPPYNDAFTRAEADLKANWKVYRRRMEEKVLHDG